MHFELAWKPVEKKTVWIMGQHEALPEGSSIARNAANYSISGIRNITDLQQSLTFTPGMHISYKHGHVMEKAVKICARYGFILIDTNDELTARIVQEFIAGNATLKELGNSNIKGRSNMDAALGSGNQAYEDYTLTGHIHILIQCAVSIAWEQVPSAAKMTSSPTTANYKLTEILSTTKYWKDLNLFPKQLSPKRQATFAANAINKMYHDYALSSLIGLQEWRCPINRLKPKHNLIEIEEYYPLIAAGNSFQPSLMDTMEHNSHQMSNHISKQLRLSRNNNTPCIRNGTLCLADCDIIHLAEKHGMPLAIAIDGSYSNQRATTNISIISPDIQEGDT